MQRFYIDHHCNGHTARDLDGVELDTMACTDVPGVMTGKPLIESDRVEGTAVCDPKGNHIGS